MKSSENTIAVTGATGMVGRAAVQRFCARGWRVVALGRDRSHLQARFADRATCWETDYGQAALVDAFSGVDVVVHLAARRIAPPGEGIASFWQANVLSTDSILRAAIENGVGRFCQASSISVYSLDNRVPFVETEPPMPMSLYGISKLACEHLAALYARRAPLCTTSLRFSRILGQDETGSNYMLMRFIQQARHKQTLEVWGEGAGARDTIYVQDVVGAIESAIELGAPGGTFNIGAGRAYSHRETAEAVNEVFGNQGNLRFRSSRDEDESMFYMDCARAERQLQWRRQWTLKTALQDMKKQYDNDVGLAC